MYPVSRASHELPRVSCISLSLGKRRFALLLSTRRTTQSRDVVEGDGQVHVVERSVCRIFVLQERGSPCSARGPARTYCRSPPGQRPDVLSPAKPTRAEETRVDRDAVFTATPAATPAWVCAARLARACTGRVLWRAHVGATTGS